MFAAFDAPQAEARTGTVLDEFLPIYVAMSTPAKNRRGFSQQEVDGMDVSVVAALLGVGAADNIEGEAASLNAERLAAAAEGREFTWDEA